MGICPGNNESAGKRKSGRVRKGNLYVRRLLCEFAHAASRTKSVFHSKFQALLVRRGYKRSIVALAHKLLRTIYFMLSRGEYYRDSATDYEALSVQRNASLWIKALKKIRFHSETSLISRFSNLMAFASQYLARQKNAVFHVNGYCPVTLIHYRTLTFSE